jgi:D-alanyl-D-alanine carboxypeptidase
VPSRRPCSPLAAFVVAAVTLAACADDEVVAGEADRGAPTSHTLDAAVEALLDDPRAEDLPGVAVFVGDREGTHLAAYGVANLAPVTPLRTDDVFRIASVSKPMVAAALMTFVEAGRLGLDDPIAEHLPADIVSRLANADRATLRQMLQMTSGIPDYLDTDGFWTAVEEAPRTFWTPEQVLESAYGLPAAHAPGQEFHYSNSNYILAQIIIEDLSGEPLSEVLRQTVFDPAGMDECSVETADTFAAIIVRGYETGAAGDLVDVTEINDGVGLGDGGVVCSVESLARFLPALFDGEIVGEEALDAMLESEGSGSDASYGLGIDIDHDSDLGFTVGHEGGSSGFQAILLYVPDDELTVALLTNSMASEAHHDLAEELLDRWYEDRS